MHNVGLAFIIIITINIINTFFYHALLLLPWEIQQPQLKSNCSKNITNKKYKYIHTYKWVCKFAQHISGMYLHLRDAALLQNRDCVYILCSWDGYKAHL